MKDIYYVSPSVLPSRSANSIHVIMQCSALAEMGHPVLVYAQRSIRDQGLQHAAIDEKYGIASQAIEFRTFYSSISKGSVFRIALIATRDLFLKPNNGLILSRNLYAAFFLAVAFRRSLLFETHQLEYGFRKWLQRSIVTRPWVQTIVISHRLKEILGCHLEVNPSKWTVLHDAAPNGIERLLPDLRRAKLVELVPEAAGPWTAICGYFGQLYSGRGVEVIEAMARNRPDVLFLVYGGSKFDVQSRCDKNLEQDNLHFGGHLPHPYAQAVMRSVDVLLMPYQNQVSIGLPGHDTARWMSPMKMFEYMASGVPLISSDLPVLREVLKDEWNSLIVSPEDSEAWLAALKRFIDEPELANSIGEQAHADYRARHTWGKRAEALLQIAKKL
jgi:hypothetical protein